jgi:hypothetical protein
MDPLFARSMGEPTASCNPFDSKHPEESGHVDSPDDVRKAARAGP